MRYQQTALGRVNHAARQAAYKRRLAEKVTHHGSPAVSVSDTLDSASITSDQVDLKLQFNEEGKLCCSSCGAWCGPLLRRHFWRRGRRRVQKHGGKT
jgi:hypothetical protein